MPNLSVNGLITINLKASKAEVAAFAKLAKQRGVSSASLIRQAMAQFLGRPTDEVFEQKVR